MVPGILASLGLILLLYRMWPRRYRFSKEDPEIWPMVSIIVPARNEEKVISRLLDSLMSLDYPHYEVLVIDDCSEDRTALIVSSYQARLIQGRERPAGWNGKQWACHQGSLEARGDYLLFTDADTVHHPEGLRRALREMISSRAQGFTTLPWHESPAFWEKLCGPFHVLLLAVTDPYHTPRPGQVFAIGQYLLFERKFYQQIGGHVRVKQDWVEDIPLAEAALAAQGRWKVYTGPALFSVRMYETLGDFIRGWRRNFRAGMGYAYRGSFVEITLFMAALLAGGRFDQPYPLLVMLITLLVMARVQRSLGHFSIWGLVLLPFSLLLFCFISCLAAYDRILQRPMTWKNRAYPAPAPAPERL